jgi:ribonuclease J
VNLLETLPEGKLRFVPLGGVGEIGKNMYVYHVRDQLLVVDCGLKFPDDDMHGVDVVVPDVRYLVENRHAIQAIVLTHGHEDHIGALAYVMPQLPGVPVYGPRLALGLAKHRLGERRLLDSMELREFDADSVLEIGHFTVEPIQVAHSIPDSVRIRHQDGRGYYHPHRRLQVRPDARDGRCSTWRSWPVSPTRAFWRSCRTRPI